MLIKIDLVLMCYGGIKRWNGFLHCSLGKCNTVFLWSESVCMSLSQTECIKYSKYLWAQLWSSPLLSSLFCLLCCWPPFILIGNSLIEINCYISDQSSCQKTGKFQLYFDRDVYCFVYSNSCKNLLIDNSWDDFIYPQRFYFIWFCSKISDDWLVLQWTILNH